METKLDFDDVLLVPQRSKSASRKEIKLKRNFTFYHSDRPYYGFPLFASNMDTTGTIAMDKALSEFRADACLHKHYKFFDLRNYNNSVLDKNIWISIGIKEKDLNLLNTFLNTYDEDDLPNICIDVANGYTDHFVDFCAEVRNLVGKAPIIMAGNVVTPEMVQELILHGGVDIVKIGIGPGSACTTRLKTGVGYPQLSAIMECAHAAHGLKSEEKRNGLICADGGCRTPADVVKAYAAGADFVMIGGLLAGTDECDGEWEYTQGIKYYYVEPEYFSKGQILGISDGNISTIATNDQSKDQTWMSEPQKKALTFYGMSSKKAQDKNGGMSEYKTSEGRVKSVPYKGLAKEIIEDIQGGIRSACTYTGATCLKDLPKTAKFIQVNRTHFDQSLE